MLDQSNLSVQRCRLILWVECSVGGYLALTKTLCTIFYDPTILIEKSRKFLTVKCKCHVDS
jgi:hypothetical protein